MPPRPFGRVELARARRRVVEQQVGEAVAAEVAGNDLRPAAAPVRVLREQRDAALAVRRVELAGPGGWDRRTAGR